MGRSSGPSLIYVIIYVSGFYRYIFSNGVEVNIYKYVERQGIVYLGWELFGKQFRAVPVDPSDSRIRT